MLLTQILMAFYALHHRMVSVALAVPLAETPLGDTAIAIAGYGRRCRRSVERSSEIKEVLAAKDIENSAQETGSDVIKKESLGGTTRDDIGTTTKETLGSNKALGENSKSNSQPDQYD
ncbi:hypothetical protein Pst134EA_022390 [Puccinia striiformis f. sp. tritici]|uniref:hypothetical protein n=1 Tax=Puccinia striiformis f. sp. tritici TaxID=168172 RepID=UPI002008043E|nr:hypothetical protein Pst134EA_022390 [Puccinia striiformis f. sp. tritici]KAH9445427.1 hypothetical protein Pst134EB_023269 [Puccinia striiformis f. sp. tritici]KAH9454899.1 hypothetical protein Pst134EA_022390 [Puccinia striiformis f. sp. tritici]KAI9626876.1 hypothetical protein H4Q26_017648 [Puccinia striiformis f. sp. tritici PST-130]